MARPRPFWFGDTYPTAPSPMRAVGNIPQALPFMRHDDFLGASDAREAASSAARAAGGRRRLSGGVLLVALSSNSVEKGPPFWTPLRTESDALHGALFNRHHTGRLGLAVGHGLSYDAARLRRRIGPGIADHARIQKTAYAGSCRALPESWSAKWGDSHAKEPDFNHNDWHLCRRMPVGPGTNRRWTYPGDHQKC